MELPESREEAERLTRSLVDPLKSHLQEINHPSVPPSASYVLEKYESRGAPLGPYWDWMPDELWHFRILKTVGQPSQLRDEREAIRDSLDNASDSLYINMGEEEGYIWGLFECWVEERYAVLINESESALKMLEEAGLKIHQGNDGQYRLKDKSTPGKFRNRVIKSLYRHMHPRYVEAWPKDTNNRGEPKKYPQRLREHVQTLLEPHVGGTIPLDKIQDGFKNA